MREIRTQKKPLIPIIGDIIQKIGKRRVLAHAPPSTKQPSPLPSNLPQTSSHLSPFFSIALPHTTPTFSNFLTLTFNTPQLTLTHHTTFSLPSNSAQTFSFTSKLTQKNIIFFHHFTKFLLSSKIPFSLL